MNDATTARTGAWWYVVSRWLEYEGEMRVAVLRVFCVAAFYGAQLLHYLVYSDHSDIQQSFHRQATYLSAVWLFVSLAVLVMLSRQWMPAALKYVTVTADLLLLTAAAALGSGPASPMVFAFALLIALAALRGNLPLLWFATLGSMIGYIVLIGLSDEHWFDSIHRTPPVEQAVVLISLGAVGIVLGQLLRMLRQVSEEMLASHDSLSEQQL